MAASGHELVRVAASTSRCPVEKARLMVVSVDGEYVRHYYCLRCARVYEGHHDTMKECTDLTHIHAVRLLINHLWRRD